MIIALSVISAVLFLMLIGALGSIGKLQKQVEMLNRYQHDQDRQITSIIKSTIEHQEMLIQHIEILKFLVEKDPQLNSGKIYYMGPIGEA